MIGASVVPRTSAKLIPAESYGVTSCAVGLDGKRNCDDTEQLGP